MDEQAMRESLAAAGIAAGQIEDVIEFVRARKVQMGAWLTADDGDGLATALVAGLQVERARATRIADALRAMVARSRTR